MKRALLKKCTALAAAAAIAATGFSFTAIEMGASAADNIIKNSTFDSGTTGWGTYKESGGDCTLTTENGKLALKVNNTGKLTYAVQVFYDIIPLYENGVYRLKYDISSTTNRYVEGMIQQNGGKYQAYTWKGLELTSEPQTVDYEFTMKYETDIMSKLVFNCGIHDEDNGTPEAHTIYIDNVSLELIDDSKVDYAASGPYVPNINLNQIGYKPDSKKVAVIHGVTDQKKFSVRNADTNQTVYTGDLSDKIEYSFAGETDYLADFSEVKTPGKYYIACEGQESSQVVSLDDSYTFEIGDNIYDDLMNESVKMLYLQRCGVKIDDPTHGHPACHTTKARIYQTNDTIDVSGGWHDAGDYGRYVVPAAKSVADLLYAYKSTPEFFGDNVGIPESGNGIPDVLDETRFELEWMMKMQAESGGVYHKVTCESFPGYDWPQNETDELIVTPITTTSTADFAASMALAYEIYKSVDEAFANECLTRAEKAWKYLEENPGFSCFNPSDITTGDYKDKTGSDKDERYWAAAQLYRATKNEKYLTAFNGMAQNDGLDWSQVGDYGNIAILSMSNADQSAYEKAKRAVISQADKFKSNAANSPYGLSLTKLEWGSNMSVANAGIILSLAYKLTGDRSYLDAAESQTNYLLGTNPIGECFVTGFGTVSPEHPHHRPSMAADKAMKGMLVGGVDQFLEDPAAKAYCTDLPNARRYVDNWESYSTNEITIYWNSALIYLLAESSATVSEPFEDGVMGDVNGDGEFNLGDIVMFQKWLVKKGDYLVKPELADMNKDGKCNVFDLCMMERKFLSIHE